MADIELVIKIPESIWVAIQNGEYCGILDDRIYNAIKNGTPIPDNATNGDMIKVLFPNCDCLEFIHDINVYPDKTRQKVVGNFDRDWWNAPYKAESEDKERFKVEFKEVTGHWIIVGEYIRCADCGRLVKTESPDAYYYCPNCGRAMSEDVEYER